MAIFGLITEGKTDQFVIENILYGYFNTDDITLNLLSPLRDKTGELQAGIYSNWYKVFEYCQSNEFKDAFQFNDYIIVQIDTEEKHYDIPKYVNGKELTPDQLIDRVTDKFRTLITEEFYSRYKERIIFAISVHSVECWLLPLYYTDKRKAGTKNCLDKVNRRLAAKGLKFRLTDKGGNKISESYNTVSKAYNKHKTLMKLYKANPSLRIFIEEIKKRNIVTKDEDF